MKENKVNGTVKNGALETTEKAKSSKRLAGIRILTMAVVVSCLCMSQTFAAAGGIAVLDSAGDKIIGLIGAKWVKALLAVALIIEFGVVAFGNAQGEGGVFKKVLPWIIGTAGILGATSIVNFFFGGVNVENLSAQIFSEQTTNIAVALETLKANVISTI